VRRREKVWKSDSPTAFSWFFTVRALCAPSHNGKLRDNGGVCLAARDF